MDIMNETVGNRIKVFRKSKHMTLQALADAIHKSRATMCKYENGEIVINPISENLDTKILLKGCNYGEIRNLADWLK